MAYGVTTARAHLDRLGPAAGAPGEIDWDELIEWIADESLPEFAGRYFLGAATQAEVDAGMSAGTGFCLWAHGEGADRNAPVPVKIVPLQRADPGRQSATGDQGLMFGFEDATALARYLDLCLAVGDLAIGDRKILVFLEVADGTALSGEYWAAWATTLHDAVLSPARQADRAAGGTPLVQPLLPGILCAFVFDETDEKFWPEEGVRACLHPLRRGFRNQCHGFWARRRAGDSGPATHSFDWINMGEYRQPREILGIFPAYMQRVPVRYLRWFDGPEGLPIPEGPLRDTLSLLTLDFSAPGEDDPLGATLDKTPWRADASDELGGPLTAMPVQFGVDKNRDLTGHIGCLGSAEVVISCLPSAFSRPEGPAPFGGTMLDAPLRGPCNLAFRYYSSRASTNSKDLRAAEATALSWAGVQIVVVWEAATVVPPGTPPDQTWSVFIRLLADHFLAFEQGRRDAEAAFLCAAETIGQPSYTPIYFAVDFPVGQNYEQDPNKIFIMPGIEVVERYFQDVHRGYRKFVEDYLKTHPSAPHYYVGAYAQADVCAHLYRCGLATHFWQPWPPTWGFNWRPFPHANAWQVVLENTAPHPDFPNMLDENAALLGCTSVDINVAWGDPGSFQVFV